MHSDPARNTGGESREEAFSLLRFKLRYGPTEDVDSDFAYEITPVLRESVRTAGAAVPSPRPFSYRAYDLDDTLYPGDASDDDTFFVRQNLDRASLSASLGRLDLRLGRQAVSFGSARVINPTDVISPFTYDALAKEERTGVDAARARVSLGWMSELDVGAVFGRRMASSESAAFVRARTNAMKSDISAMAMWFRENRMLGLDIARPLGGAGSWAEGAFVFANDGRDYLRLSLGLDYSFTPDLYAYAEYHLNGAGSTRTGDYPALSRKSAYTEGSVYLLGRNYLGPGLTYRITPLVVLGAHCLLNMDDTSALGSLSLEYNVSENAYLSVGSYAGFGSAPEATQAGPLPRSEFGLYPDVYFGSFKTYF